MQRGSSFGNFNASNSYSAIPLEINELQLEMEILRRKQMLLAREQQLLDRNSSSFQSEYFKVQDRVNKRNSTSGFAHLYENQRGVKRSNPVPIWQSAPQPAKRLMDQICDLFSNNSNQYTNAGRSRANQSKSRIASYSSPPQKKAPNRPSQRNPPRSTQSNVSSPKTTSNLNTPKTGPRSSFGSPKTGSNTPQSRKMQNPTTSRPNQPKISNAIKNQTNPKSTKPSQTSKNSKEILYADKSPSPFLIGRLELALGHILKEIKENYVPKGAPYDSLFTSHSFLLHIKKMLRSRLREVMLGKAVLNMNQVMSCYRVKYPEDTDIDLIKSAEENEQSRIEKNLAIILSSDKEDSPDIYFKKNFHRLLQVELTALFEKLENLYKEENGGTKDDAGEAEKDNNELKKDHNESENEKTKTPDDGVITIDDESDTSSNAPKKNEKTPKDKEESTDLKILETKVAARIRAKLPTMLPKYKDFILKMFDLNAMYRNTKETIITNTIEKLKQQPKEIVKTSENEATVTDSTATKEDPHTLPYYVKIFGKPALADRTLMMPFLKEFQPKSVKKHTTVNNLLFVGFHKKENFDNILNANGTVVGDCTLTISAQKVCAQDEPPKAIENMDHLPKSDKVEEPKNQDDNDDDDVQIIENASNENNKIDISDELETEISQLLNSIQSQPADEKTKDVNEGNDSVADKESNSIETNENLNPDDQSKDN